MQSSALRSILLYQGAMAPVLCTPGSQRTWLGSKLSCCPPERPKDTVAPGQTLAKLAELVELVAPSAHAAHVASPVVLARPALPELGHWDSRFGRLEAHPAGSVRVGETVTFLHSDMLRCSAHICVQEGYQEVGVKEIHCRSGGEGGGLQKAEVELTSLSYLVQARPLKPPFLCAPLARRAEGFL